MKTPQMTFAGYVFDPDGTLYLGDGSLAGAGETPGELERPSGLVRLTDEPLEAVRPAPRRTSPHRTGRTT